MVKENIQALVLSVTAVTVFFSPTLHLCLLPSISSLLVLYATTRAPDPSSCSSKGRQAGVFSVLNCTVNVQFISPVQIITLLTWAFFLEVSRPMFYV